MNTCPCPAQSGVTMKGLINNCGLLRNKKMFSFDSITHLTVCVSYFKSKKDKERQACRGKLQNDK